MMPAPTYAARPPLPTALTRLRPATRLAALVLGLLICFTLPASLLAVWLVLLVAMSLRSGLTATDLVAAAKPWWPLALIIVAIHALTTTAAAPLGHPSTAGAIAGVAALVRVATTVLCLWIFARSGDLSELTAGLSWWLQPLRPVIGDPVRIGIVLAVAAGAVPRALADARRIDAVVRLRRSGTATGGVGHGDAAPGAAARPAAVRWWRRLRDRGQLAVPMVEGIFRRADGMSLALVGRLPQPDLSRARPTAPEVIGLLVCLAAGCVLWYLMKISG